MKTFIRILYIYIFVVLTFACRKPKNIDIVLPSSQIQTSVECYIEPEKPIRLLLSETADSYTSGSIKDITDAFVAITHGGTIDTLIYLPNVDSIAFKGYNYYSPSIVQFKEGEQYTLYIKVADGKVLTAQTSFIKPVDIDTAYQYELTDRKSLRVEFYDNKHTDDYYRLTVADDTSGMYNRYESLFNDQLFMSSKISINTTSEHDIGDSTQVTLYHLDKPYYDFIRSVNDAKASNGDPFAIPSQIRGNINGGIGIFQALTYQRKRVVLKP